VNLVSAPARVAAPKPAPAPKLAPAPKPVSKPKAIPKKVVLPSKPAPLAKKPKKVVRKPEPRPEPLEYEDALAALREELGEEAPTVADETPPEADSSGEGERIPAEVARWIQETTVVVQRSWITPPKFLNRSLVTLVRVHLSAGGEVIGTPEVIRSSGDPFWDDSTLQAVVRASPLPAPPEPGAWEFRFSPEENR
jgi:TonB family protein